MYMHIMERVQKAQREAMPVLPCACANLRRASRAVTRLYNREMQQHGIEVTQFTLLMALQQAGEIPQGKLGKLLGLDSTSLTRMLELLRKQGWVQAREGEDRRVRLFSLTAAGREKLLHATRHWKRAQERLRATLGEETMRQLAEVLAEVTHKV
jgi:DNA-binding MarR family transcriptional regulator